MHFAGAIHYTPDADGDHLRLGLGQELIAADGAALYHNAVLLRRHALKLLTGVQWRCTTLDD